MNATDLHLRLRLEAELLQWRLSGLRRALRDLKEAKEQASRSSVIQALDNAWWRTWRMKKSSEKQLREVLDKLHGAA